MSHDYTAAEEEALREALRGSDPPTCPRCGSRLLATPVRPPPGVAYVRHRVILQCSSCGRRAAVDREPHL